MKIIIVILFQCLILKNTGISQNKNVKNSFILKGEIIGKKSGIIILFYTDSLAKVMIDTAYLKNGKFTIRGIVKGVSDAHLFTDTSNKNFSAPSVIRFLLEPSRIYLRYKISDNTVVIAGSQTQKEKENLDDRKASLLFRMRNLKNRADSLYRLSKLNSNTELKNCIHQNENEVKLVFEEIKNIDLKYIQANKTSLLSGYLLSTYKVKIPLDTLKFYYTMLSESVKNSIEGIKVLRHVYPLINDSIFRSLNPAFGLEFNNKLISIKNIYDFTLPDTSNKKYSFSEFENNYLLIDFWASWCGPCIDNFPFWEKLTDDYKTDSIKFISVSIDTDKNRWKNAIIKYNLKGLQVIELNGIDGLLPVYCKVVTGIPRYVLVGKDGKIINYNTPFPSNDELKRNLDSLLKKN